MNWKPISGYEGIYEVSDKGEIKTIEGKTTYTKLHGVRSWSSRILKLKTDKYGYKRVTLWLDGKPKDFLVHRLVATEFCEKHEGKNIINHIDGNPANNHYKNLEWCNHRENLIHAFINGMNTSPEGIKLTNKADGEEHLFYSMAEASKFLGKSHGYVSRLLKQGKHETKKYEITKVIEP